MKKGERYIGLLAGTLMVSSIVHGSKQNPSMPGLEGGNMPAISQPIFKVPSEVSEGALILADALLRDEKDKLARRILEQVGISYTNEFLPNFNPTKKPFDDKLINRAKMQLVRYFYPINLDLCIQILNNIGNEFEANLKFEITQELLENLNKKQSQPISVFKPNTVPFRTEGHIADKANPSVTRKLGCYATFAATFYLDEHDAKNLVFASKSQKTLFEKLHKNPWPLTRKNQKLLPNLDTQVIYTPLDYIKPGRWRYIIAYPVTTKEIKQYVKKLKPNSDGMPLNQKNIIFDCKIIDSTDIDDTHPLAEESVDVEIKKLLVKPRMENLAYEDLKHLEKPIIFKCDYESCEKYSIQLEVKENCKCLFEKGNSDTFADYNHWKNYAKIIVRNVRQDHSLSIIKFLQKKKIPCQSYTYCLMYNFLDITIQKNDKSWLKEFNKEEIKAFKDNLFKENEKKITRFPILYLPEVELDMGPDVFQSVSVDAETPEELKRQLNVLLKDKNVKEIMVPDHLSI